MKMNVKTMKKWRRSLPVPMGRVGHRMSSLGKKVERSVSRTARAWGLGRPSKGRRIARIGGVAAAAAVVAGIVCLLLAANRSKTGGGMTEIFFDEN